MQVELVDGSGDYAHLQAAVERMVEEAASAPELRDVFTAFRGSVPQVSLSVDRTRAATRNVNVGDVYAAIQTCLGSTFVNLFTRFGHNYMVYVQADPEMRRVRKTSEGCMCGASPATWCLWTPCRKSAPGGGRT